MTAPDDSITLDDVLAEMSPHGRELVEQAIGSARRIKELRNALAEASNANQPGPRSPEPAPTPTDGQDGVIHG